MNIYRAGVLQRVFEFDHREEWVMNRKCESNVSRYPERRGLLDRARDQTRLLLATLSSFIGRHYTQAWCCLREAMLMTARSYGIPAHMKT